MSANNTEKAARTTASVAYHSSVAQGRVAVERVRRCDAPFLDKISMAKVMAYLNKKKKEQELIRQTRQATIQNENRRINRTKK